MTNTNTKEPKIDFEEIAKMVSKVDPRELYQFGDKPPLTSPYLSDVIQCPAPFSNYLVSQKGIVYSKKLRRPMVAHLNNCGYQTLALTTDSGKKVVTGVHRLVANAFLDNKWELTDVGHINDNRVDNSVFNLEFISHRDNLNKSHRKNLLKAMSVRPVKKINDNGTHEVYQSIHEAAEANHLSNTSVSGSAAGTLRLNKPFHFIFIK